MAEPPPDPNSIVNDDEGGHGHEPGSPPKTPRWVKVFAIIAVVVIVLVVAILLFGRGEHGPGRHMPGRHAPSLQQR